MDRIVKRGLLFGGIVIFLSVAMVFFAVVNLGIPLLQSRMPQVCFFAAFVVLVVGYFLIKSFENDDQDETVRAKSHFLARGFEKK